MVKEGRSGSGLGFGAAAAAGGSGHGDGNGVNRTELLISIGVGVGAGAVVARVGGKWSLAVSVLVFAARMGYVDFHWERMDSDLSQFPVYLKLKQFASTARYCVERNPIPAIIGGLTAYLLMDPDSHHHHHHHQD
eukprot:TRINITY_DN7503_c0_g4_i4.p1 TRINITY_DN7503_c0_g4~~TRINITY_DN7503_c0_g4_i4.p1  ORF type:complete len:135 (+),score=35.72 TRINITY_DN7503_c0_g4_i4:243-647(+)